MKAVAEKTNRSWEMTTSVPRIWKVSALIITLAISSHAAIIYTNNFTDAGSAGSVGGGILTPSATLQIGSGPWSGTYNGTLSVVAPPVITVGNFGGFGGGGFGSNKGVLGVNINPIHDSEGLLFTLNGINL